MRKKTILKIERDLKRRAKKMRLGKKRSGAYVYGTLRKIRGNPSSRENFRAFLMETLIPDLKESGYEFTAEDFETIVWYLDNGKDKDYARFKSYIMGRLVPDLKKSGRTFTARDFVRGIKFIDKGNYYTGGFFQASEPRGASRVIKRNPVNDVLEILTQDQILAEYKKGGEGQQAKLMFTSKPMSGMSASQLVRKIGNYNNFSWRRVSPFLGKLHFMNQSLTLPMTFRVGREYSPAIYIENVDMPRYANRLIEYAKKNLKADEATYTPVARRVRLWWD